MATREKKHVFIHKLIDIQRNVTKRSILPSFPKRKKEKKSSSSCLLLFDAFKVRFQFLFYYYSLVQEIYTLLNTKYETKKPILNPKKEKEK